MAVDRDFFQARLQRLRVTIVAYEDAIDALTLGNVQSYSLNTSQTTQSVTRFDLPRLTNTLDTLYNRYATLEARLSGCGVTNARPHW